MNYRRELSIQDISCVGQCSTTVALPIISACGQECAILPSAVLSTHTAGFTGYTVRDLSGDFPAIFAHWKKEGLTFDCIYTGYLGSEEQIDYILDFWHSFEERPLLIVDPAMGDNGKLYPAFGMDYVKAMRRLCEEADVILPNQTELDFLLGESGKEMSLKAGAYTVLTGASRREGFTGVEVKGPEGIYHYEHEKMPEDRHGTGDVYSSCFVGALMRGKSINDAARIAADFTLLCVKKAQGDSEHFYGVRFETELPALIRMLGE